MTKTLKITTLGPVDIQLDGISLSGLSAKAKALLIYLAYTRQSQTRGHLTNLLFGSENHSSVDQARKNLRTTLSELNKQLESDTLQADGTTITFNPTYPHEVDALAFEQALQNLIQQRTPTGFLPDAVVDQARKVIDLYQGEFLADLVVRNAPDFEDWQASKQSHLESLLLQALERLTGHALATKSYQQGEALARRLLQLEPAHEKAHHYLMELLAKQGRRDEALRQYQDYYKIWTEELAAEPSPEITALYERIRTGQEPSGELSPQVSPDMAAAYGVTEQGSELESAERDLSQARVTAHNNEQRQVKKQHYFQWGAIAVGVVVVSLLVWLGSPWVRTWWATRCLPHCPNENLSGLDLRRSDLSRSILRWADLSKTNLSDANLRQSDLEGAALWNASLRGADLSATNLSGADLNWAELHFAKIDETTQISEKWHLVWEIVNDPQPGRDLHGVDLSKADLHESKLIDADLYSADLHEAELWSTTLTNADLRRANLNKANLRWADLTSSKLNGADLRGANLSGANLEKADLTDALYNDETIWPQGFDPTATGAKAAE